MPTPVNHAAPVVIYARPPYRAERGESEANRAGADVRTTPSIVRDVYVGTTPQGVVVVVPAAPAVRRDVDRMQEDYRQAFNAGDEDAALVAIAELGASRRPEAIDALEAIFREANNRSYGTLAIAATHALGAVGRAGVVPVLSLIYRDADNRGEEDVATAALAALRASGRPEARELLQYVRARR